MSIRILTGDCIESMRTLEDGSVQTCVTSPPYWGLRDYGHAGQIGLESTFTEYVDKLVSVFREVRRVLRDDGTVWLNLGDSYASTPPGNTTKGVSAKSTLNGVSSDAYRDTLAKSVQTKRNTIVGGLKPKDLVGIPWRVAFALQADGWYLRQDIIWAKPNPMPESVRDRCTKAHEYMFLLAKRERYYFDADAIAEAVTESTIERLSQPTLGEQEGSWRVPGKTNGAMKAVGAKRRTVRDGIDTNGGGQGSGLMTYPLGTRNKRSVWTVTTQPFSEAHFATFPPALIEPCILAGSRVGDTVLDPFSGAGTTALVADRLQRHAIGCELNPEYVAMSVRRIERETPLFAEVAS